MLTAFLLHRAVRCNMPDEAAYLKSCQRGSPRETTAMSAYIACSFGTLRNQVPLLAATIADPAFVCACPRACRRLMSELLTYFASPLLV